MRTNIKSYWSAQISRRRLVIGAAGAGAGLGAFALAGFGGSAKQPAAIIEGTMASTRRLAFFVGDWRPVAQRESGLLIRA